MWDGAIENRQCASWFYVEYGTARSQPKTTKQIRIEDSEVRMDVRGDVEKFFFQVKITSNILCFIREHRLVLLKKTEVE